MGYDWLCSWSSSCTTCRRWTWHRALISYWKPFGTGKRLAEKKLSYSLGVCKCASAAESPCARWAKSRQDSGAACSRPRRGPAHSSTTISWDRVPPVRDTRLSLPAITLHFSIYELHSSTTVSCDPITNTKDILYVNKDTVENCVARSLRGTNTV